jgi:uncharacterized BrkB/YihY/UPF0761 family membrane protein
VTEPKESNLHFTIYNFQFAIAGWFERRTQSRFWANKRILFRSLFSVLAMLLFGTILPALAQCPMCRASVEGSPEAAAATSQWNIAVLVLLVPPVAMFVGMFVLIYRYRNFNRSRTEADGVAGN